MPFHNKPCDVPLADTMVAYVHSRSLPATLGVRVVSADSPMRSCSRDSAASKSYVMTQTSPEEQVHDEASDGSPSCLSARVIEKRTGEGIVSAVAMPHRSTHGSSHAGRVVNTPRQVRARINVQPGRGVTWCIFYTDKQKNGSIRRRRFKLARFEVQHLSRRLDHH